MEKYLKKTATKIGIIFTIIFGVIFYNNDYMKYKDRKCIVLDKLTSTGGYRRSGHFYLILKEQRGIVFDLIVSPATYSQTKIKDIKHFYVRELEIKQSLINNIIFYFGQIIIGGLALLCFLWGILDL